MQDKSMDGVYYLMRVIIVTTVSILIVLSNILNIYILAGKCHIPIISKIFLLNSSVSDLCVGLISCLPTIYSAITEYWPYGPVWCQIAGIFHGASCAISIWSIAMMSIDRYVAICKPLSYNRWKSKRMAYITIVCLWIAGFISVIIPPLTKKNFIYYQFDSDENICGLYWEYKWFCIATALYGPLLSGSILMFTNVKIIQTILHVTRNQVGSNLIRRRGMSAVKLLMTTSSIYFLAWGPYVTSVLLTSFLDDFHTTGQVSFFFMWLANSNSFMNVVTYSVIYRSFRLEIKHVFLNCLRPRMCTSVCLRRENRW